MFHIGTIQAEKTFQIETRKISTYIIVTDIVFFAWFMAALSGINGIKMMSNLDGLPYEPKKRVHIALFFNQQSGYFHYQQLFYRYRFR